MRRQLSLYVEPPHADAIERVRAQLDPVQQALIPAHVTLCRDAEAELLSSNALAGRIAAFGAFALTFGRAEPFDGHGVRIPCVEGVERFRDLRRAILQTQNPREESPHITLAHPRNPMAPGNDFSIALQLPLRVRVLFHCVRIIEQAPGEPWRTIAIAPL